MLLLAKCLAHSRYLCRTSWPCPCKRPVWRYPYWNDRITGLWEWYAKKKQNSTCIHTHHISKQDKYTGLGVRDRKGEERFRQRQEQRYKWKAGSTGEHKGTDCKPEKWVPHLPPRYSGRYMSTSILSWPRVLQLLAKLKSEPWNFQTKPLSFLSSFLFPQHFFFPKEAGGRFWPHGKCYLNPNCPVGENKLQRPQQRLSGEVS